MFKRKDVFLWLLLALLCGMWTSCVPDEEVDIEVIERFADIKAESFDFKTTRKVQLRVQLPENLVITQKATSIIVFQGNPSTGGKRLFSMSSTSDMFEREMDLPSKVDSIYVFHSFLGWQKAHIAGNMAAVVYPYNLQRGNTAFEASLNSWTKQSLEQSQGGLAPFETNLGTGFCQNPSFNGASNIQTLNNGRPLSNTQDRVWYRVNGDGGSTATFEREPVYQFTQTSGFDGLMQKVSTTGGRTVSACLDYNGERGTVVILYLYAMSGDRVLGFTTTSAQVGAFAANKWQNLSTALFAPSGTDNVRILAYVKAEGNKKLRIDNGIILGDRKDSDSDGIEDVIDQFPNDYSKAFISYYPNQNTFGTTVFEDLWPTTGDYDFNDLTLSYQYKMCRDASNKVTQIDALYVIKALGAGYKNGFGVSFPFDKSYVKSVVGPHIEGNVVLLADNGLEEQPGSNAVIIVYEDLSKAVGGQMINVDPADPYVAMDTTRVSIELTAPLTDVGRAPFNPFIYINADRGREVHLKGLPPTALANPQYFNTGFDDTEPAAQRYYQTANGLPWALDFPVQLEHMKEKEDILYGYLKLPLWAQSNGIDYLDWYSNPSSSYRNDAYTY